MNPEPSSTQAPALAAAETVPNPAPDTSNFQAAANEEDISTNDVPLAGNAQRKQEGSKDDSVWPSQSRFKFDDYANDDKRVPEKKLRPKIPKTSPWAYMLEIGVRLCDRSL
jgi:hypothetical protein